MMPQRFLSRRRVFGLALGSALGWQGALARAAAPEQAAASWPDGRPIKIIACGAADGLADNMIRAFLAERLGTALQAPVEVQTLPGADGLAALARAAPDGRALAFADSGAFAPAPAAGRALLKDFAPVASVFALPTLLLATPALSRQKAPDFAGLLAYLKQKPGEPVRCAIDGSAGRLVLEQIRAAAGADAGRVRYADSGALGQKLAGQSDAFDLLAVSAEPTLIRQIKEGKLRPLAVGAPARIKEQLPDVPTLAELGQPGANLSALFGFFAPAGTPADIVQKLNQTINAQSRDEVGHHIDAQSLVAVSGSADDFARRLAGAIDSALAS
jgi:tripartite-type tricarboxylate transporter receptor subunit TctC